MILRDHLAVGCDSLKVDTLVRIQVPQHFFASAYLGEGSSVPSPIQIKKKKSPRSVTTRGIRFSIMTYFVYILECTDNSLYAGCTNNLERRLKQHNNSKWGAHYTKIRRPVVLKHSEEFKTLIKARRRESEIKGWSRSKKLALINRKIY
jgi:putative endonuclease